jgi:hypothetical protein
MNDLPRDIVKEIGKYLYPRSKMAWRTVLRKAKENLSVMKEDLIELINRKLPLVKTVEEYIELWIEIFEIYYGDDMISFTADDYCDETLDLSMFHLDLEITLVQGKTIQIECYANYISVGARGNLPKWFKEILDETDLLEKLHDFYLEVCREL